MTTTQVRIPTESPCRCKHLYDTRCPVSRTPSAAALEADRSALPPSSVAGPADPPSPRLPPRPQLPVWLPVQLLSHL